MEKWVSRNNKAFVTLNSPVSAFNLWRKMADHLPDSALLIVMGIIIGVALWIIGINKHEYGLSATVFFLFLLPPIAFDAGYFMPNRAFFEK